MSTPAIWCRVVRSRDFSRPYTLRKEMDKRWWAGDDVYAETDNDDDRDVRLSWRERCRCRQSGNHNHVSDRCADQLCGCRQHQSVTLQRHIHTAQAGDLQHRRQVQRWSRTRWSVICAAL